MHINSIIHQSRAFTEGLVSGLPRFIEDLQRIPTAAPMTAATAPARVPQDVFDGMRKSFQPALAKGVHATYQFNLSGPNGGHWYIIVDNGKATISKGTAPHADVTFTTTDADWVKLSNGTESGTVAVLMGRLKVDGPKGLARKLNIMFP